MINRTPETQATVSDERNASLLDETLRQTVEQTRTNRLPKSRGRIEKPTRESSGEDATVSNRVSKMVDEAHEHLARRNERLAALDAVAAQIVEAIYAKLPVSSLDGLPVGDARAGREHLAQVCHDSREVLRSRYNEMKAWLFKQVIAANVYLEEDRSEVQIEDRIDPNVAYQGFGTSITRPAQLDREQTRAKNLATKQQQASEEITTKVLKQLDLPAFRRLVPVWFGHDRLEEHTIDELYAEAPAVFRQATQKIVRTLLEGMIAAHEQNIFGDITIGRESLRYSFGTHRVLDKLSKECTFNRRVRDDDGASYEEFVTSTEGTRTISHVLNVHELMDQRHYDFPATLNNPSLEIPPHFRVLLEDAPEEIRPHLTSVFGTQITELAVARDIESKKVLDEQVIARSRVLACEPCVVFGGNIVLWGWGAQVMQDTTKIYREHASVLKEERKLLADAHRAEGSFMTNQRWSAGLISLAVVELLFAIKFRSTGAVLMLLPILLFAGIAVWANQVEMRMRWTRALRRAEQTVQDGFRALVEKYPAFDPKHARIAPPGEDQKPASKQGSK